MPRSRSTLLLLAVLMLTCAVAGGIVGALVMTSAQAEVGDTDRTTATYADESSDFVIPYDGYLMLDSTPLNGGIELRFELYEFDPTINNIAASPEWTEVQTITAYNGRFSVGLGSTTPINQTLLDADQLFLSIAVSDGAGGFVPLGGYQAIEPVPYAIWSAHAANLNVAGDANVAGTMTAANVTGTNSIYALNTLSVDGNSRLGNNPFQDFHSIAGELQVEGQVTLGMAGTNSTTVSGPLQVNGNTTLGDASGDAVTTTGSLRIGNSASNNVWLFATGTDFYLGTSNNAGRGDGGRAMVQQGGDSRYINYQGDFSGGTVIQSALTTSGDIQTNGNNVDAASGSVLGLNTVTNRPIQLHVDTASLTVDTDEDANMHRSNNEATLNSTQCNSGNRGAMVVGRISRGDSDALCFCAYHSTENSYKWNCIHY